MKNPTITPALLCKHKACTGGYKWAASVIGEGMPLSDMLPLFERADWMLWLLGKTKALDKVGFVRCAVICAESVLDIFECRYPADKRPRKAIEAAIAYVASGASGAAAYSAAAVANDAAYSGAAAYSAAAVANDAAAVAAKKLHHKKLCALILAEINKTGVTL